MLSAQSFCGLCLQSVARLLMVSLGMCHCSTAVLQVANAGLRRPGYQATELAVLMYSL